MVIACYSLALLNPFWLYIAAFQDSGQHHMTDRSFLWSGEVKNESYNSPQPPAKRHKPAFNLSLFGASSTAVSLHCEEIINL